MRPLLAMIGLVAGCGDLLGLDTVQAPQVPAYVHSNSTVGVTTNMLDVALPFATRGDLIVVAVCFNTGAKITSVSDVDTPAYTELSNKAAVGVLQAVLYYAEVAATHAPFDVRVLFQDNVATPDVRVAEYSNVNFPDPVENAGVTNDAAVMSIDLDISIKPAPALLFAATCVGTSTMAVKDEFTIHEMTEPNGDALADRIVTSDGVITATASQTGNAELIFQLVAFEGGTPP